MRADSIYWSADVAAFFKAFFVISFLTVVYTSRIGKVAAVFVKMKKIWRNKNISLKVKTRLYEAIILSTLRCLQCKTDNRGA